MLHSIIWILIALLFIGSFIGLVFPIIPSALFIWVAFILYHFIIDTTVLSVSFWVIMVILTAILFGADIITNRFFVKQYGGSKWGERVAALGVIVGSFILPPFGILLVPFIAVLFVEMGQKRTSSEAVKAAFGSLLGFLGGTFAKFVLQLIMITWFLIVVLF
ncbi:DUF456 family protein [Virgibacillus sp. LDC-1]|uniref:DUF456 domain-containing protein n=1 Tax=Virgibacillus sp. LDC-1 TaxID=3039856 RepID=UPI0024DE29CC|nr:DUF456 family protein [Virgibacillus sp. LDC-1]